VTLEDAVMVHQVWRRNARYLLAGVRLVNGVTGLVAPRLFIGRIDGGRTPSPAAIYAFRMFGIRTVLLGLDLLARRDAEARQALRAGVLIHASDTVTATLLGVGNRVSPRTAVLLTLISAGNVALALTALGPAR
jgi:hypothetical protein